MSSSSTNPSPFERFVRNVSSSAPPQSRRDVIRGGALLAAAATISGGVRAAAAPSPAATGRRWAQDDIESDVEITIPFNPFGLPVVLDPHRAPNWGPFWVLLPHVWSGLLAFDELGAVVPDLAVSVEPNETADVWTATLKPDLLFASGNPITAQSFVDSWLRALNPQLPSPMASFMELVQGFDAYVAGESDDIGFTVVDNVTIEITLSEPYSSFPASLATFVWAVVDGAVIDDPEIEDPALAGAGAGLWQFSELVDGERIVMTPNDNAAFPLSPSVTRVVWQILDGPGADDRALDLYRNDMVVSVDVPGSLRAAVEGDDALAGDLVTIESQASTTAIGMDFNQAPFGDLRVRRAVASAVDRDAWANDITGGEWVPATGIVPPVVSLTAGYEPASPIAFDPAAASSLLEEAGIDAANMPDIVYYQAASDSAEDIARHEALLAMIAENSGLVVRHDATLTTDQITALQGDNSGRQFDIVWWWTVTDTAALVQTVGSPDSPFMTGWFNWSPELDSIDGQDPGEAAAAFTTAIATANAATDTTQRNEAHRQAEQLLIDTVVYVPLGHWVQRFVQKRWLQGTRQGPWSGRIPVRIDADVVVLQRPDA